eukprot:1159858-Pelagomonas_calceolata.AAC.12
MALRPCPRKRCLASLPGNDAGVVICSESVQSDYAGVCCIVRAAGTFRLAEMLLQNSVAVHCPSESRNGKSETVFSSF